MIENELEMGRERRQDGWKKGRREGGGGIGKDTCEERDRKKTETACVLASPLKPTNICGLTS